MSLKNRLINQERKDMVMMLKEKDRGINVRRSSSFKMSRAQKRMVRGAEISKFDPKTGITWAWFGGHYIHGYDKNGTEAALFSTGSDYSKENVPEKEIRKAIASKLRKGRRGILEHAAQDEDYYSKWK